MSNTFGFEDAIIDLERLSTRVDSIQKKIYEEAIEIRDDARNIATGLGLHKSGKGVSGIEIEKVSNSVEMDG